MEGGKLDGEAVLAHGEIGGFIVLDEKPSDSRFRVLTVDGQGPVEFKSNEAAFSLEGERCPM